MILTSHILPRRDLHDGNRVLPLGTPSFFRKTFSSLKEWVQNARVGILEEHNPDGSVKGTIVDVREEQDGIWVEWEPTADTAKAWLAGKHPWVSAHIAWDYAADDYSDEQDNSWFAALLEVSLTGVPRFSIGQQNTKEKNSKLSLLNEDTWVPTVAMGENAERALEWNKDANNNMTQTGYARARDLKNRRPMTLKTIKKMNAFFSRHEVDKKAEGFNFGEEGFPSNGRIAWDAWGGDEGQAWAKKIVEKKENSSLIRRPLENTIFNQMAETKLSAIKNGDTMTREEMKEMIKELVVEEFDEAYTEMKTKLEATVEKEEETEVEAEVDSDDDASELVEDEEMKVETEEETEKVELSEEKETDEVAKLREYVAELESKLAEAMDKMEKTEVETELAEAGVEMDEELVESVMSVYRKDKKLYKKLVSKLSAKASVSSSEAGLSRASRLSAPAANRTAKTLLERASELSVEKKISLSQAYRELTV